MNTYKLIRYFMERKNRTIDTSLSLKQVQEHCSDPEASSKTCTKDIGQARTKKYGPWFDCYRKD